MPSRPSSRRFKVILSDLVDVDSQTPNNSVALLEDFVSTSMAATTLDNCLTESSAGGCCFAASTPVDLQLTPPCDYFLSRRSDLTSGIAERCEELTSDAAESAWGKIRRSFANRLADKFPFLAEPSQPLRQEATPADFENFLRVYDRNRYRIAAFLTVADRHAGDSPPPWNPNEVAAVRGFVSDMDAVRELFAPFLAARAESAAAVPTFDLQVQFRVNQANEKNGNQIFAWAFEVGETTSAPGEVDPPGRWTYGQPVRLSLAWAANAQAAPSSPSQANARLVDKTVIYEFQNAWALVSLLKQYAALPTDFTGFVDTDPETLAFEIPIATVEDDSGDSRKSRRAKKKAEKKARKTETEVEGSQTGPASTPSSTIRVFIRITLMTPDGSKAELAFPTFPTEVPEFPSSSGSAGG